ncbi:hypothetical protein AAC387_Pa11g2086 [Persea americana]
MADVTGGAEAVVVDIEVFENSVSQHSPNPSGNEGDGEEAHMAEATCAPDTIAAVDMEGFEDCIGYLSSSTSDDEGEEAHVSFKREDLNPNWVSSIKGRSLVEPKILKASSASKSCSIHRVPYKLRKHNPKAYDPQLISIGPFHYEKRKGELRAMEEHKWRYLRDILSRKPEGWLEDCLATFKRLEEKARDYYSEVIALDSDSFVEMMLLDGCFIIELFRKCWFNDYFKKDVIFLLNWPRKTIYFDLILMENQIPFFIVRRLSLLIDASGLFPPLVGSAINFLCQGDLIMAERINGSKIRIRHLLHLLHTGFILFPNKYKKPNETPVIGCASKLQERGIKFRKRDVSDSLLDIKFARGLIEIPRILVWDQTEIEFLNFIAFEQCYPHCPAYITAYFHFMDCLVNTAKDVDILCQEGIIDNRLGDEDSVASHFNNMARGTMRYCDEFYLSDVCEKINLYSERSWPKLRASLVHDYFNNPWAIISFFAGVFFLLLAVGQTFFTSFPKFAFAN